ncbi:type II toxin-antitoxin system RelE/ParE family toxin [Hydrogenophaga sp.]|uniref:type II toxin-antitoxin system RelE/ParE family toxin n=1 Tax=Hydrogenophaga sp. TaxID=1904254 RepID=UPI002732D78F|nr:type II toxin-antitoxin system RelE/ParE family toxin [Hydrogenophaga sp.]MDP1959011.1 type II toxin-antitoxin system RelE/ParE family toxin [Methylotenera sp.]MDP3885431.1 type II toxin-antitoxin system RelE/ParE family toxin [Hydrogenophaga sp.]
MSKQKVIIDKVKPPILKLTVKFFASEAGSEPVKDWLKSLPKDDRVTIGTDIKTIQIGWPLGMPLVDHIGNGIWEVRTRLTNQISRILFIIENSQMILLHGFIKKTPKTPKQDIELAEDRIKILTKLKKQK